MLHRSQVVTHSQTLWNSCTVPDKLHPCCAAGSQMAQLVCTNPQCMVVLMYPRGANQVQCSVCGHVNDAMAVST